jgi:hypothetical protein
LGSLERRLGNLEACGTTTRAEEKDRVSREALRRMTTEDLHAYVDVLRRVKAGEGLGEEDRAILRRFEDLYEEVRDERRHISRSL